MKSLVKSLKWKLRGGGGSQKPKYLKESMGLKWNFQRAGEGVSNQKTFHGRGMDIFWDHTM